MGHQNGLRNVSRINISLQIDTGDAICHSCTFDKTGKSIVVGSSDGWIKTIDIEKAEIIGTMKGHDDSVNEVIVNQDNSFVYSISSDGTLKQWK